MQACCFREIARRARHDAGIVGQLLSVVVVHLNSQFPKRQSRASCPWPVALIFVALVLVLLSTSSAFIGMRYGARVRITSYSKWYSTVGIHDAQECDVWSVKIRDVCPCAEVHPSSVTGLSELSV